MTRDDILRMAREAGIPGVTIYSEEQDVLSPDIELFAELIARHILSTGYPELVSLAAKHAAETVAAAEREACLNLCYTIGGEYKEDWAEHNEDKYWERCLGAEECADAIRARGQE